MDIPLQTTATAGLPAWVPTAVRHYLDHIEAGLPIRALARRANVHASTILRQVRRYEGRRDDPLIDDALRALSRHLPGAPGKTREAAGMTPHTTQATGAGAIMSEERMTRDAARVLRRLSEPGAVLAVARDMEMGVVVREGPDGTPQRTAVVERDLAQAMALRDWISCTDTSARIARYHLTALGRTELRRMLTKGGDPRGMAEAQAPFRAAGDDTDIQDAHLSHLRSTLGESPLAALARRRDKDGKAFLPRELVAAGERLREDFELSQTSPGLTQDWDRFLTGNIDRSPATGGMSGAMSGGMAGSGAGAARDRVVAALRDLGPGLSDVVLRCCCYLEGLETLERRMNWSARSGKIVLRIALQRLKRHYAETGGRFGPMIG